LRNSKVQTLATWWVGGVQATNNATQWRYLASWDLRDFQLLGRNIWMIPYETEEYHSFSMPFYTASDS
jgi:hypothetical protein